MAKFERKPEYQALPWPSIREQYETTDISLRMLAMQHGLSSKTVLIRKVKAEGWTRRVNSIANLLSLAELAGIDPAPAVAGVAEKVDADSLREEADRVTIITARALATLQTACTREQLSLARNIQTAGLAIIERIRGVLVAPEAEVSEHIKRLIAISPDGEKLAGLIKAAAEVIDRAVVMERRALGMDLVGGKQPEQAQPPEHVYSSANAVAIVKKLDVTLGMRLRQFTQQTLEARRDRRADGEP